MDDERGSKINPHKCKELHGIKILLITRDRKPSDFNSTAEGGGGGAIPGPGPGGLRAGMTLSGVGVPSLCGSPLLGRLNLSFGQMAGTTVGPQPRTLREWKCLPLASQPELSGQLCWTQSAWLEPLTCPQTPHSGHEHGGPGWLTSGPPRQPAPGKPAQVETLGPSQTMPLEGDTVIMYHSQMKK